LCVVWFVCGVCVVFCGVSVCVRCGVCGVMWCVCVCACSACGVCVRAVWCVCVMWCVVVCVFLNMKEHIDGRRHSDDDLQHAVLYWLNRLAAEWYDMGIIKLVSRYDKCLNVESDYVETLVKVCATTCIFVFFPIIKTYFLIAKRTLLSGYPS
jgi:hypothetical protein